MRANTGIIPKIPIPIPPKWPLMEDFNEIFDTHNAHFVSIIVINTLAECTLNVCNSGFDLGLILNNGRQRQFCAIHFNSVEVF